MFVTVELLLSICSAIKSQWKIGGLLRCISLTVILHSCFISLDLLVSAWLIIFLAKSWTAVVTNGFLICSPFREDPDLEISKIIYLETEFFLKVKSFAEEICILPTTIETTFYMNSTRQKWNVWNAWNPSYSGF